MVFFKIKVNVCILIHPIIDYKFWGNHSKLSCLLILHFPLIPQVTSFFFKRYPIFFSKPNCCMFFLHPIFWVCKQHLFPWRTFLLYNHELSSSTTMLNSPELNQNNKLKAKACNWSVVFDEMQFKYDGEASLCYLFCPK